MYLNFIFPLLDQTNRNDLAIAKLSKSPFISTSLSSNILALRKHQDFLTFVTTWLLLHKKTALKK